MKIIKFYSDTCGPCRVLDANLKKLGVKYESINVNEDTGFDMIDKYKIQSVPVLIKEDDNGNVIARHNGLLNIEQLKEWLNG